MAPNISPSTPGEQKAATKKEMKRKRISVGQPCLICEEPANGYRYGVPACHACTTFFRCAIISGKGENFKCPNMSHCDVACENRVACRKCRLDKCLEAGMNQHALQGLRDRRSSMVKIPVQLDEPPASSVSSIISRAVNATQLTHELAETEDKCGELHSST